MKKILTWHISVSWKNKKICDNNVSEMAWEQMYFQSMSGEVVSLLFSWLILDFLHQTRGYTWKRSKIRLLLNQRGYGNPIEWRHSDKVWWCPEIVLGHTGLVVMMLRPRNHAWTQSQHLMKALLEAMLLYKHQLLHDIYIYIYIYIY